MVAVTFFGAQSISAIASRRYLNKTAISFLYKLMAVLVKKFKRYAYSTSVSISAAFVEPA